MNAKNNSRKHASRGMRRGRLALALALALLAPAAWAGVVPSCTNCLPEVGTVVSGAATSNLDLGGVMRPGPTTEDTMTITQTTSSAIINWNTLNVAGGFTLNFVQPDANSVTLNRVIGVPGIGITPSIIHGNINANGNVFIINPTGILFGKSSAVNVGGLVASTLAISDSDFLTGAGMADPHYIFTPDTSGAIGPVVNQGQLTTAVGGTIALLAARIENQPDAVISAPGGSVTFGAAQGVNLDFYNDGLTTVTLTGTGFKDGFGCAEGIITSSCAGGIVNNGDITAAGGHVEMRTETEFAATNGTLFTETVMGGRIWIGGTIRANSDSTYTNPGSIILDAGHGNVDIGGLPGTWPPAKGLVSANAFGAGQDAGTIEIRGYQLFTHLCVGLLGVCNANDSLGWIDATANGAGGNGGQITIDVMDRFYNAGLIQAASFGGNGGTINIVSGNRVENYNWILAESGAGTGGTITITAPSILLQRGQMPWLGGPGILYSQAVLSAYGATNGGSVNLFGGLSALDSGGVTPGDPEYVPYINVRGMNGNGGSVMVSNYDSVYIHPVWFINANGTANGGT
ncbi:MAG TPA: filamentous hemagglutinin N-terminal domain-containing protein, partial [Nitrospira sp.]|nr:filamentous hemagglutinin N-terminal domain-containing protein [Nitrospira sp.]